MEKDGAKQPIEDIGKTARDVMESIICHYQCSIDKLVSEIKTDLEMKEDNDDKVL